MKKTAQTLTIVLVGMWLSLPFAAWGEEGWAYADVVGRWRVHHLFGDYTTINDVWFDEFAQCLSVELIPGHPEKIFDDVVSGKLRFYLYAKGLTIMLDGPRILEEFRVVTPQEMVDWYYSPERGWRKAGIWKRMEYGEAVKGVRPKEDLPDWREVVGEWERVEKGVGWVKRFRITYDEELSLLLAAPLVEEEGKGEDGFYVFWFEEFPVFYNRLTGSFHWMDQKRFDYDPEAGRMDVWCMDERGEGRKWVWEGAYRKVEAEDR